LDNKRTLHIGGQLGNQLLRCFIALADSLENNYEIASIKITHSPNYLEELLELKVPAELQAEEKLNDIDHNAEENVHKLFKYRSRIFQKGWVKLKGQNDFIRAKSCLHIRGTDKKVAPLEWYYKKAKEHDKNSSIHVCTDDRWRRYMFKVWLISSGIRNVGFSYQDAVSDWFTLLHADRVYCSSSSFPLSTLLFNPDKHIIVCSRKSTNYDYQRESRKIAEFLFIETAMNYCPNLRFED